MSRVRLDPNLERKIAASGILAPELGKAAETIRRNARAIAPRSSEHHRHYADQIVAEVGEERGIIVGRVTAKDRISGFIEFGTGEPGPTPAFAPLRRGAMMAGYRLRQQHGS